MHQKGCVVADVTTGKSSVFSLLDRLGLDGEVRVEVIRFFQDRGLCEIDADLAQETVATVIRIEEGQTSRDLLIPLLASRLGIAASPEFEGVVDLLIGGHPPADSPATDE